MTELNPLEAMFIKQLRMQREVMKTKAFLADSSNEEVIAEFRTQVLALTDELHEALNEMGWKPWASSDHINAAAVMGELVDAWHFLMNLILLMYVDVENPAGHASQALYAGFMEKNLRNIERQKQGYDGVSGKCPICKRAYDDPAVECMEAEVFSVGVGGLDVPLPAWCATKQRHVA